MYSDKIPNSEIRFTHKEWWGKKKKKSDEKLCKAVRLVLILTRVVISWYLVLSFPLWSHILKNEIHLWNSRLFLWVMGQLPEEILCFTNFL